MAGLAEETRQALAHVDPREIVGETGLGSGDDATDAQLALELPESVSKMVSKGLLRGNPIVRLAHRSGGAASSGAAANIDANLSAMRTAQQEVTGLYGDTTVSIGATALSLDTQVVTLVNDGTRMEAALTKLQQTELYKSAAAPVMTKAELAKQRMSEAKLRGYEGTSCSECHNFTMVRNGTCLKCDTCGSTSGCS